MNEILSSLASSGGIVWHWSQEPSAEGWTWRCILAKPLPGRSPKVCKQAEGPSAEAALAAAWSNWQAGAFPEDTWRAALRPSVVVISARRAGGFDLSLADLGL